MADLVSVEEFILIDGFYIDERIEVESHVVYRESTQLRNFLISLNFYEGSDQVKR